MILLINKQLKRNYQRDMEKMFVWKGERNAGREFDGKSEKDLDSNLELVQTPIVKKKLCNHMDFDITNPTCGQIF